MVYYARTQHRSKSSTTRGRGDTTSAAAAAAAACRYGHRFNYRCLDHSHSLTFQTRKPRPRLVPLQSRIVRKPRADSPRRCQLWTLTCLVRRSTRDQTCICTARLTTAMAVQHIQRIEHDFFERSQTAGHPHASSFAAVHILVARAERTMCEHGMI